jgi:hypothetical protein
MIADFKTNVIQPTAPLKFTSSINISEMPNTDLQSRRTQNNKNEKYPLFWNGSVLIPKLL